MIKQFEVIPDYDYTKLKKDEDNPNILVGSDKESHEKSLVERGQLGIVLIDQNDLIINGTHTWEKCIKDGNTTGPVIKKTYKNDVERRIDRQIMNYGPRGVPDKVKQQEEILKIYSSNGLDNFVKLMNKPKDEYLAMIANSTTVFPDIPEVSIAAKPTTKHGQIYVLNKHRVMCGDSTNPNDVLTLLESDTPRLLYTDPPYDLEEYNYLKPFLESFQNIEVLIWNDDKGTIHLLRDYFKFFVNFFVIKLNSSGVAAWGNQPRSEHRLVTHFRKGKSNFQNLRDAFGTVHEFILRKDGIIRHEKPLEIPRRFIIHYTKPGELIIDLFGGAGSTLIAAEQLGRNCLMMEKDPLNVDKIVKRWESMTHQEAELIH